ncbi:hypothetical protein CFOL_v3_22070, partial [Cephalotus follicularis]
KEVLKKGLKWRIGNGINTEIWNDNGISTIHEPPTPTPSNVLDHNAQVSQQIVWDNGEWDRELVRQCFDDATTQAILSILLPHRLCADKHIWSKHLTGNYTVKSGYRLAYGLVNGIASENVTVPAQQENLWKWFWSITLPHKINIFGGKCCRDILPTLVNLVGRVPQTETICKIFHARKESMMRAIFKCPWAARVWEDNKLAIGGEINISNNMTYFLKVTRSKLTIEKMQFLYDI